LARLVEEAFDCAEGCALPRNKAAFAELLAAGTPRLAPAFQRLQRVTVAASTELSATLRALESAGKHPSGTAASAEIRTQIELLFPADLLATVELSRLEQFPRYLRAAQARLTRAISDPRKDADKLAPFAKLWQPFLAKRPTLNDREGARALRWAFEELRVSIFAPELKPQTAVTLASLTQALGTLR